MQSKLKGTRWLQVFKSQETEASGVMVYNFYFNTLEVKVGGYQILGQPVLHGKMVSRKTKTKFKKIWNNLILKPLT